MRFQRRMKHETSSSEVRDYNLSYPGWLREWEGLDRKLRKPNLTIGREIADDHQREWKTNYKSIPHSVATTWGLTNFDHLVTFKGERNRRMIPLLQISFRRDFLYVSQDEWWKVSAGSATKARALKANSNPETSRWAVNSRKPFSKHSG